MSSMPPTHLRLLPIALFALTVGLWMRFGDGSAWRTTAVVIGAALISWALIRTRAPHGAVECESVERQAAERRDTARERERASASRRGHRDRVARPARDVRCDASGGLRSRRHRARRRARS